MPAIPELILTKNNDSRSFTFPLKGENQSVRDVSGQQVRVVLYNHWTRTVYFNDLADIVTNTPAVVSITIDDTDMPSEGFYDVMVRVEELDGGDNVVYAEPYKIFNCYIQGGPTIEA